MQVIADRKGNLTKVNSTQDKILKKLYTHWIGRILLKPLVSPAVSKIGGFLLNLPITKFWIPFFIKNNSIPMEEYEQKKYRSYNDFFTRKLLPDRREIEMEPDLFISPCDSKLSVSKIDHKSVFSVKHTKYTAKTLLKNKKLAEKFVGGYIWIFRLSVEDYHHYIYADSGKVSKTVKIPGIFHTVNPIANDNFPIYKENSREYCLIQSKNFGAMIQMEVGALLVGKIENIPNRTEAKRGQEKGHFAFGGSTIIIMTQKDAVLPDKDLLKNTMRGIETRVKLGERIGSKGANP